VWGAGSGAGAESGNAPTRHLLLSAPKPLCHDSHLQPLQLIRVQALILCLYIEVRSASLHFAARKRVSNFSAI